MAALALLLGVAVASPEGDPPRYRFEVGQVLVYKTTSEYSYKAFLGLMHETLRRSAETRIWVVRKNADGSFRLCVRHTEAREDEEPEIEFGWCDVQPDGRVVPGPTLAIHFDASGIFKPLPPAGATEWEGRSAKGDRVRVRLGTDGLDETALSGSDTVAGATCTSRCTLDRKRWLPERIETVWSEKDPAEGRRTTSTVLADAGVDAAVAELDRGLTAYAAARDEACTALRQAQDEAAYVAALKRCDALFLAVREKAKHPALREELDRVLAGGEEARAAMIEDWRWQAGMRGKPAPDWALDDLDGGRHALKDYRGKVVILDFWYAECGPCRLAMPVLRDLAERHEGKVAVLGMNTDSNPEATRQVVAAMELNYPTLRARGLAAPYWVRVAPTTVILDRQGVVRRVLEGYSPRLGAELEATVEELLREPEAR